MERGDVAPRNSHMAYCTSSRFAIMHLLTAAPLTMSTESCFN